MDFLDIAKKRFSVRSYKKQPGICHFKPDVIIGEFGLPDHLEPINILAIGYADEEPADMERHEKTRIPMSQLVSY